MQKLSGSSVEETRQSLGVARMERNLRVSRLFSRLLVAQIVVKLHSLRLSLA